MKKLANTDYDVLPEIEKRWSPRAFDPNKEVESENLRQLFEAARWAASSFNEQPWRYIVASRQGNPEVYEKILNCLNEFNQDWAKQAPVLAIAVGKVAFSEGTPGAGEPNEHYQHDVGAAAAQLTLQATSLGLFVHQMAGFDDQKVKQEFGVPQGFQPVTVIALGHQAKDATALPDPLAEQESAKRSRKPQDEFVWKGWEDPADF